MASTPTNAAPTLRETRRAVLFPMIGWVSPARMRTIRLARRLLYLVLVLGVVRYGWVLIHLKPAAPLEGVEDVQAILSAFEDLTELGKQLPVDALLPADTSLPNSSRAFTGEDVAAGTFMVFRLNSGLSVDWRPDPNTPQARVLTYVEQPMTQATLDAVRIRIDALMTALNRPLTQHHILMPNDQNLQHFPQVFALLRTFLVDARVAVDEYRDAARAQRDLVTALNLARLMDQMGWLWGETDILRFERIVLLEMMLDLQIPARAPTYEQAIIRALEPHLDPVTTMLDFYGLSAGVEPLLDPFYTTAAAGRYFVPSHAAPYMNKRRGIGALKPSAQLDPTPWSAFWNLGAPAFDSRAQTREHLEHLMTFVTEMALTPADQMAAKAQELNLDQVYDYRSVSRGGGSYRWLESRVRVFSLRGLHHVTAQRRAVYLMARLAAYRAEHLEYPESLAELEAFDRQPAPLDLNTSQPFIYQRRDDGGYDLESAAPLGAAALGYLQESCSYVQPRPDTVLP